MFQIPFHENKLMAGYLNFQDTRLTQAIKKKPSIVSILPKRSSERATVVCFIQDIYRCNYGADIEVHYPFLMSVSDPNGAILAAIGFRYAEREALFLEQYTQERIEMILNSPRSRIVEIGNLASLGGGTSMFLFAALASYLNARGVDYGVVTGTKTLEKRLHSIGLQPERLCRADPCLLHGQSEDWGSYYESEPFVMAGRIDLGYQSLQRVLGAHFVDGRPRLLPRLHFRLEPVT